MSDVPAACDKPIPEPDVIGKEENIEPIEHSAEKEVVEKKESTPVPPPSISPQVAVCILKQL